MKLKVFNCIFNRIKLYYNIKTLVIFLLYSMSNIRNLYSNKIIFKLSLIVNIFILLFVNDSCRKNKSYQKENTQKLENKFAKITKKSKEIFLENNLECKSCGNEITKPPDLLIVYIHGLSTNTEPCATIKSFIEMKRLIEKDSDFKNIKSLILDLGKTLDLSIADQTKRANLKLKNYFKKNPILKKDTKIILIGHSAGGLVCSHLCVKYKNIYNFHGMVIISCPWNGINIFSEQHVTSFAKTVLKSFKNIYNPSRKGIVNLLKKSKYLNWIKNNVKNIKIPVLIIGGRTEFYKLIFNCKNIKKFFFKSHANEECFFGTKYHDGVVPLESQLGYGINFPKNFKKLVLNSPVNHSSGFIHKLDKLYHKFTKLIKPFLTNKEKFIVTNKKKQISILDSRETTNAILKFLKKISL